METNINIKTINQFIDGELRGESLTQFEELLKTDADLQKEVHFQNEVMQSLKAKNSFEAEKNEMISFLNELEQNVEENDVQLNGKRESTNQTTIIRKILPLIGLATAAAVLLFVLTPWRNHLNSAQLADNNFTNFPLESVRSTSDKNNLINEAKKAYSKKNYQAALPGFQAFLEQNLNAPNIWLARGSTEYQLNLLDNSVKSFEQSYKQNPSFKAIAHWYLALTYLKKEEPAKAKDALLQISKSEEKYGEAQKLLKQIEKIN